MRTWIDNYCCTVNKFFFTYKMFHYLNIMDFSRQTYNFAETWSCGGCSLFITILNFGSNCFETDLCVKNMRETIKPIFSLLLFFDTTLYEHHVLKIYLVCSFNHITQYFYSKSVDFIQITFYGRSIEYVL